MYVRAYDPVLLSCLTLRPRVSHGTIDLYGPGRDILVKTEETSLKISMWMLANRLSSLDLSINIKETAAPVLKSARRAYATNCVFVYQDDTDLVCEHNDDWIRIHDMPLAEGFELIQNVFDYYDDWYSNLRDLTARRDYQGIIDSCWPILNNPVLLLNGNRQVLGLSSQYRPEDMDDEWRYLIKYGFSSVSSVRTWMKNNQISLTKPGIMRYKAPKAVGFDGVTCAIFSDDRYVGRINILEKDRRINNGDCQILEIISDTLRDALALAISSGNNSENIYIVTALLMGRHVEREIMTLQLSYRKWYVHDQYRLYLISLRDMEFQNEPSLLQMLAQTMQRQMLECIVTVFENNIVVLHNITRTKGWSPDDFLNRIAQTSHFRYSISLPSEGIFRCSALFKQAEYALRTGASENPEEIRFPFFNVGIDYILESSSLTDCAQAAHPDIVSLWRSKWEHDDGMLLTMKEYLNNDRSLVGTAQALFIHRNTLVYRLKKLEEIIHADLDDLYTRDYMKLSIRILELVEKQCVRSGLEQNAENVINAAFPDYYPGLK